MLIHQMDVVTAFLNGTLHEEIYMQQPDGYKVSEKEHLVCKLNKFLYGLKQSPRCWNKAFQEYMELIGFTQSTADPCVYIRVTDTIAVVAVYVDDLILLTETPIEMEDVKRNLTDRFKMKDMNTLHYCLGISIVLDENKGCIWLLQTHYVCNLLNHFGLTEAKTVSTPSDLSVRLDKADNISINVDPVLYQSIVGSLL